ncbi:MAG TPA: MFS transporter, partial [Thermoplasmata archaeon]|nr:MFS transporter [Thermoplasmata archaeon]
GIRERGPTLPVAAVARHEESLTARLHQTAFRIVVPFFPVRPRLTADAWRKFRRWFRAEMHHELPLILLASVLFNLSANLFNISYVPYLADGVGLGASTIFLVNFANSFAQSLSFPPSGTLTSRVGADRVVQQASYVRSLGYLGVVGFTFVPFAATAAFGANALAFAVLGAAIAFYTTSSSMILFRALEGRDAGRLLGLSSALGGMAAVAGAVLSGVLSFIGSYRLTFLVAAGALIVSLPLWSAAQVANARRRFRESPAAARAHAERAPPAETD